MSILNAIRFVLALLPAGWSVLHLGRLLRKRLAPAEAQTHFTAFLSGALLACALWPGGQRPLPVTLLLGALGVVCSGVWFYLVYRQSLHNTTM